MMDGEGGTAGKGGGGTPGGTLCLRSVLCLLCSRPAPHLTFPHPQHVLINIHVRESVGDGMLHVIHAVLRFLLHCAAHVLV